MKKEIWGFNVIGPQGLDARNDFAVGPNDEGDDVVLRVNQAELTGKEFETLKEIAEGGPTPGGGGFPEQDLDDPTFVPEANHYYKQKAGEKPAPVMTAFTVGQTLNNGDKIHFDTTKGSELETYLQNNTNPNLIEVNNNLFLGSGEESGIYLLFFVINNVPTYIYSSQAVPEYGIILGFQNLDENGDFIISLSEDATISSTNDTTPPTWNGVIIGTLEEAPASQFVDGVIYFYDGEEYHAITGEGGEGTLDYNKLENVPIINLTENKTTVLSPFEVGQALNSESVLHIDTNKEEEFLSYLQTLEYPEQSPIAFFMRAKRTADSALIILLAGRQDNIYRFGIGRVGEESVGEESKMIYVSQDFYDEETGTQYYKGFQNLDANGNLQFTQLLTPADGDFIIDQIVDTNPPTWNGVIISAVTEETVVSPTPVDGEFYKRNGQIYKYTAAKPGESQPELFDKVVLESEINGATIVDLGSIEMDGGNNSKEWHITKEQYDQAFGDNVIVKVTITGSDGGFTLYAPKNSQYTDSDKSRLSFSGMVDVQQFYMEIGTDDPGEYMAYLELIKPDRLYRHDIVIDCTAPDVFKVYLSVVYYNDNQVSTLSDLNNLIGSGHDYPVSGYYNNLSTGLKPAICVNTASNSVSMKYIDGASEYSATCGEKSTFTITDSVTTLAK